MAEQATTRGLTRRGVVATTAGAAGAALSGALLAACGPAGSEQGPAAQKEPVPLSFLSWRPPAMDQFAPFWQEYSQKHNVILEVDKSGDGGQEKLTTMFAAGSGPDLFDANTRSLPKMYNNGIVLEVTKYLSRDKINLDKD
ncbi:MAG: extracellular solute-binding protein, partial [Chloroflexota bacterium]